MSLKILAISVLLLMHAAGTGGDRDHRLAGEELVYGFELDGQAYAIRADAIRGGLAIGRFFFYRAPGTAADVSEGYYAVMAPRESEGAWIVREKDAWFHRTTGQTFSPGVGFSEFTPPENVRIGNVVPRPLTGADRLWSQWSQQHENIILLDESTPSDDGKDKLEED